MNLQTAFDLSAARAGASSASTRARLRDRSLVGRLQREVARMHADRVETGVDR